MSSVSCSYTDILIESIEYLYISWKNVYLYDVLYMQPYIYGRLMTFPEITLLYVRASVCMQGLPGLWLPEHFLQLKQINALIYISLWELG